jgi:Flp pilus assembly pilin Flp
MNRVDRGRRIVTSFVRNESGQDLVEYALLAAFVGISGWVALSTIAPTVGAVYSSWLDPTTGAPSLWEPPAPAGGGS